jgi:hypothetical protein
VFLPGVGDLGDDPDVCHRATDWLSEVADVLAVAVYDNLAELLDLEDDLVLLCRDTLPTHGIERPADPPRVAVGVALTRDRIPIRVWCWPGDTGDDPLIRQVETDLRGGRPRRVVWVQGRRRAVAGDPRVEQVVIDDGAALRASDPALMPQDSRRVTSSCYWRSNAAGATS